MLLSERPAHPDEGMRAELHKHLDAWFDVQRKRLPVLVFRQCEYGVAVIATRHGEFVQKT